MFTLLPPCARKTHLEKKAWLWQAEIGWSAQFGERRSLGPKTQRLGICFVLALANLGFSKAGVRLGHRAFSISPGT